MLVLAAALLPLCMVAKSEKHGLSRLIPRMGTINDRIDRNAFHKEALIENLQSGKYDVWFSKPDREANPSNYEHNLLQSIEN